MYKFLGRQQSPRYTSTKKHVHTKWILKNEQDIQTKVIDNANKIFARKHGQRLKFILLNINDLQTPTNTSQLSQGNER